MVLEGMEMATENEDEVSPYCFVCTECHSDQRINPYTNVWVGDGKTPPCKNCGGVVIFVEAPTWEALQHARSVTLQEINLRRTGSS